MATEPYLKGPALFALARRKASSIDLEYGTLKMVELIREVQVREGHTACFRTRKNCSEMKCCWQVSCRALMGGDG